MRGPGLSLCADAAKLGALKTALIDSIASGQVTVTGVSMQPSDCLIGTNEELVVHFTMTVQSTNAISSMTPVQFTDSVKSTLASTVQSKLTASAAILGPISLVSFVYSPTEASASPTLTSKGVRQNLYDAIAQ